MGEASMTIRIINADVLAGLAQLPADSVDCVVTSPPYFGLRSYLPDDHPNKAFEIGQEKTPQEFVDRLVAVFAEVRRVLKPDGTCWLNIGDSYNAAGRVGHGSRSGFKQASNRASASRSDDVRPSDPALKPKDLIGIPWRVAFALQADGWWLRQDIIWAKPNPMPESVTDRCTKAHEYVFLLTKGERYFYDAKAIQEPAICGDPRRPNAPGQVDSRGDGYARGGGKIRESVKRGGFNGKSEAMADDGRNAFRAIEDWRNKRSVWSITTQPFPESHFATMPPELAETCIKAGCRPGGTVLDPFGGAGTTALVADRLQRNAIGIELNEVYVDMAQRRIDGDRGGLLDMMEAS